MKLTCLMENTKGQRECLCEHGLSFYIETAKHKLLVDTGASSAFLQNAQNLGVDIKQVDMLFLSHGHYDHAGGILAFANINQRAPIWMQKTAGEAYYHKSETDERYIGIDERILALPQIKLLEGNKKFDEELSSFSHVTERRLWPSGNQDLKVKREEVFLQDEFEHEQYLVIEQEKGRVLISGCAHNGILNILNRYRSVYGDEPLAVFSGFHLRKKTGYTDEDRTVIKELAQELKQWNTRFYTGHCTGEEPYLLMKEIMGTQLVYVHSGDTITL